MRIVILSYPDGAQQEITLAEIPRVGEIIRRKAERGRPPPPLLVQQVSWIEGDEVLLTVREEDQKR